MTIGISNVHHSPVTVTRTAAATTAAPSVIQSSIRGEPNIRPLPRSLLPPSAGCGPPARSARVPRRWAPRPRAARSRRSRSNRSFRGRARPLPHVSAELTGAARRAALLAPSAAGRALARARRRRAAAAGGGGRPGGLGLALARPLALKKRLARVAHDEEGDQDDHEHADAEEPEDAECARVAVLVDRAGL